MVGLEVELVRKFDGVGEKYPRNRLRKHRLRRPGLQDSVMASCASLTRTNG